MSWLVRNDTYERAYLDIQRKMSVVLCLDKRVGAEEEEEGKRKGRRERGERKERGREMGRRSAKTSVKCLEGN